MQMKNGIKIFIAVYEKTTTNKPAIEAGLIHFGRVDKKDIIYISPVSGQ